MPRMATLIPITRAAEITGINRHTIRRYCQQGLIGRLHKSDLGLVLYVLTRAEVNWLRKNPPKRGGCTWEPKQFPKSLRNPPERD